jgi:hypothetical protein
MILLIPYTLLILFLAVFVLDSKKGILIAVVIRPIIECFYEHQYAVAGFRPPEYLGFLLPIVLFLNILLSKNRSFLRAPNSIVWILYIYFQLFGTGLIYVLGDDFELSVNYFFRAFNGFIGFFIFQQYFQTKKDFQILLIVHLIAGIFPLGMSLYQNLLGGLIRSEMTTGGLIRNIGLYHDAYTMRLYSFQTLAAVILYWCYFVKSNSFAKRSILTIYSLLAGFTIYKLFSKAGYIIVAEWLIVWTVAQKKFAYLGIILIIVIAASLMMKGPVFDTLDIVYSKEIGALKGVEKADRLFAGRVGAWKVLLKQYADNSIALKLFGDGAPHTDAHNDYLRALLGTGVLGLLIYLVLLGSMAVRTINRCLKNNTPLNTLAVMLVFMWLIDSIGLVPGAYTGYQIFVWGFVGLALHGVMDLGDDSNTMVT